MDTKIVWTDDESASQFGEAYMTHRKPVRYCDRTGKIGSFDAEHPEVKARLASGDLSRLDH